MESSRRSSFLFGWGDKQSGLKYCLQGSAARGHFIFSFTLMKTSASNNNRRESECFLFFWGGKSLVFLQPEGLS